MNTFGRFFFLALFGSLGAAIAVGLAVSSGPRAKHPIQLPVANLQPPHDGAPNDRSRSRETSDELVEDRSLTTPATGEGGPAQRAPGTLGPSIRATTATPNSSTYLLADAKASSHEPPHETNVAGEIQACPDIVPPPVTSSVAEAVEADVAETTEQQTEEQDLATETAEDTVMRIVESRTAEVVDNRAAAIVEDPVDRLVISPTPVHSPVQPRAGSVTAGAYPAEATSKDSAPRIDSIGRADQADNPRRVAPVRAVAAHAKPRLAETQPSFAQQASPSQLQLRAGPLEPTVPVSTMMQVLDKLFERDSPRQQPLAAASQAVEDQAQPTTQPQPAAELLPPPSGPKLVNQGDDLLTINTKDTDIREVLDLISQGTGMNILATKNVSGTVTASLHNVTAERALASILKSTGYVAHREDNIIYVGTADEFKTPAPPLVQARVLTRVYQPNYITAAEFQQLITSLLTPDVGTVSVTTPAENGIQSDSVSAGGDKYANPEIVLVRDFEPVLFEIDQVLHEVDKRPLQVAIEAMILSVKVDDSNKLGVNFELLRDHIRIISGSPPAALSAIKADGGLKVGYMDSSLTAFLEALETVGDTNVIATPRLTVLNKQRAEILIGSELGYVSSTVTETALTQSVEFLEVGTSLRIRPFVSSDGQIRMEVHPELSTGTVRVEEGFTLPDKETTQVTTNIIAKDGSTIIIGGLIREDLVSNSTQIPLFGSLPVIGPVFRQKSEDLDRREIIVLITPRIMYDDEAAREGDYGAMEFHHRQAVALKKNLSPLATRHLSLNYLRLAQQSWARGDAKRALWQVNLAIHYDPQSRAAIDLRADIVEGNAVGDHTGQAPFIPMSNTGQPLDGAEVAPWVLDGLEAEAMPPPRRLHPWDAGRPGPSGDLMPQPLLLPQPLRDDPPASAGPRSPATSRPSAAVSDRNKG